MTTVDNKHTIRISFGLATPRQIESAIREAAIRAKPILGYLPEYRINIAYSSGGRCRKWGYIYTKSERFYSLLIGESVWVEQIDPEWSPPSTEELRWLRKIGGIPDELDLTNLKPVKVKTSIPLLNLDNLFEYTEEQKTKIINDFGIARNSGYIKFKPAITKTVERNQHHNILISYTSPPRGLNLSKLNRIFNFYSTSKDSRYPMVEYTGNKLVKVTFDPETADAEYALLMTLHIYEGEPGRSHYLSFNYMNKV